VLTRRGLDEGERIAGKNYRGPAVGKEARGPTILYMFCPVKLILSDQAQVTLQLRVSRSDLVSRFLASSFLLGRAPKHFFRQGPEPAPAAWLECYYVKTEEIK